jgi:hypothetical protein
VNLHPLHLSVTMWGMGVRGLGLREKTAVNASNNSVMPGGQFLFQYRAKQLLGDARVWSGKELRRKT